MKRTTLLTLAALIGALAAPTAGAQDKKPDLTQERVTAKKSQDGTVVEKGAKRAQKKQDGEAGKKQDGEAGKKQDGEAGKKGGKKGGKKSADGARDVTLEGERIENPRLRKTRGLVETGDGAEKKVRDGAKADRPQKADSASERAADARADHAAKVKHIGDLTRRVRAHKVRLAELARLEAVFQGKGEAAKVTRVQELRAKEQANYETILARYESLLGKEDFASFRKRVRLDDK